MEYKRIPTRTPPSVPTLEPVCVPEAIHARFERHAWDSHFIQFLNCCLWFPHSAKQLENLCIQYRLGGIPPGSGKYAGAIVFPFIDQLGRIRSLQAAVYDPQTNKRKEFNWIHKLELARHAPAQWALDFQEYQLRGGPVIPCPFGAHLINDKTETVLVYEAPKTALYMALRCPLPGVVHVATAGQSNLTADRLRCAKGKRIVLCPDLSENGTAFADWSGKAERLRKELGTVVMVEDSLERIATPEQRAEGWDWADFIADFNWMDSEQAATKPEPEPWAELKPWPEWNPKPWPDLPSWDQLHTKKTT
jgi:hypothetical protein